MSSSELGSLRLVLDLRLGRRRRSEIGIRKVSSTASKRTSRRGGAGREESRDEDDEDVVNAEPPRTDGEDERGLAV